MINQTEIVSYISFLYLFLFYDNLHEKKSSYILESFTKES